LTSRLQHPSAALAASPPSLGTVSTDELAKAAAKWHRACEKERAAASDLYAAIVQAVKDGMSEVEAADVAGVNRMTVRRALGKL